MIRKRIPRNIKKSIRISQHLLRDLFNGDVFKYAKKRNSSLIFTNQLEICQDLKPNDAKVHNLKMAIEKIESVEIMPNEIFSFWKSVGNPTKNKGFVESRSIVNGIVQSSIGGGLCQLSGLIYYISLQANLDILERYNHSIDIYTEETRFTPLGSDATVAHGFKDLRVRNTLTSPIKFSFALKQDQLTIQLKSTGGIAKHQIKFINTDHKNTIETTTLINNEIKNKSTYQKNPQTET